MSDGIKYDVVQSGSTDLLNQNNQSQVQGAQQAGDKQSTTVDYGKGSTSEYKDPSPDSLLGKHVRANELDHPMGSVKLKHLGAGMRELIQLLQTESHDAPIYGSNTNGSFVKFADGTMICFTGEKTFTSPALAAAVLLAVVYPAAFVAGSVPVTTWVVKGAYAEFTGKKTYEIAGHDTNTGFGAYVYTLNISGAAGGFPCSIKAVAVGRYK